MIIPVHTFTRVRTAKSARTWCAAHTVTHFHKRRVHTHTHIYAYSMYMNQMQSQLSYWSSEFKERENEWVPNACITFCSWHSNTKNKCHRTYMHVCTNKFTLTHTSTLIYTLAHTHARTHTHADTQTHTHIYIYVYTVCEYLHAYICTYMYTHSHVDTHTYTYTCVIHMMVYNWF